MNQKRLFLVILAIVTPIILFIYHVSPDLSVDQEWTKRLAELESNLEHLQSLYRVKQEDVTILSQYLGLAPNITLNSNIIENLSPDTQNVLKNISQRTSMPSAVRLPSISQSFLPHLIQDTDALRPVYLVSKGRKDVSIVLGIPSVKRIKQSYLIGTLDNLITNMNEEEQNETLIVVFIAETDLSYVELIAKEIEIRFSTYVENGLIEILSPSQSYYPSWDKLKITLNDPQERVKWRSKQNLDFAYMMAYSQSKGTFYVQLEDDILAKNGFISIMKSFALEKTAKQTSPWFVLDFCQLGFIGKMFKSTDLPYLITYFQMFYNDQPVDWLLEHLIYTKICNWDKAMKACKTEKSKIWIHFKPSLFQHIGTTSSLKGKVQKLKDKQFGKINNFYPHANVPAVVKTNIATYKSYTLQKAYVGDNFFWGLLPQAGDTLQFIFTKPTLVKKYLFRSGNYEHPSDRFDSSTTVEVSPVKKPILIDSNLNITTDGYIIIGNFNLFGIAEGTIDSKKIGMIKEMRLRVHSDSENWIILSEIMIAAPKR